MGGRAGEHMYGRTINPSWYRVQRPFSGPLPHPYFTNLPFLKDRAVGTAVHLMLLVSLVKSFGGVGTHFRGVKLILGKLGTHFGRVGTHLRGRGNHLGGLGTHVGGVGTHVGGVGTHFRDNGNSFGELETHFGGVRTHLGERELMLGEWEIIWEE